MVTQEQGAEKYLITVPSQDNIKFTRADLVFTAAVLARKSREDLAKTRKLQNLGGLCIEVAQAANESRKHVEEQGYDTPPERHTTHDPKIMAAMVRYLSPRFEQLDKNY